MNKNRMRGFFILCLCIVLSGCRIAPHDITQKDDSPYEKLQSGEALLSADWTAFQFGPWLFDQHTPIYGVGIGFDTCNQNSYGLFSSIGNGSVGQSGGLVFALASGIAGDSVFSGLSSSLIFANNFIDGYGTELPVANGVIIDVLDLAKNTNGAAIGCISGGGDTNGVQISGIYFWGGRINGLLLTIFNVSSRVNGLALGVLNDFAETPPEPSNGVTIGVINMGNVNGLQIGLFNETSSNGAIQLGLLNHNRNGIIPWTPIINFSHAKIE